MTKETITVTLEDDDGNETEHELPSKMIVCERCEGHGTHLTPSIGEHAYSQEEFYDSFDDEGREEYFRRGGIYDVTCFDCKGKNVVQVVDSELCEKNEKLKPIYEQWCEQEEDRAQSDAEYESVCRMERLMGC